MKINKIALGLAGVTLTTAALFTMISVSSAEAGGDVSSNPEQTAYYEPEDSKPTISPDQAYAERVENFPALQPYNPSEPLLPVSEIIGSARAVSGDTEGKSPVYAASLAYGDLSKFSPGLASDSQIAKDRPVWVLTVHNTIQNYGALSETKPKVWDVYTVVFDGPTGDMIASGTGQDIEKLGIEGAYVE